MKPEVFGVVWTDRMLGHLTLTKSTTADAIETAKSMRDLGVDKIYNCHAVHVPAGADTIEYLD